MPSKLKNSANDGLELTPIPKELIKQFVKGPMTADVVNAVLMAFKKALIERTLGAEMGQHAQR